MSQATIYQLTLQPQEVANVVQDLEEALNGHAHEASIVAMLSLVMVMQHPAITREHLQKCVNDASKYICLILDEPVPGDMN